MPKYKVKGKGNFSMINYKKLERRRQPKQKNFVSLCKCTSHAFLDDLNDSNRVKCKVSAATSIYARVVANLIQIMRVF